MHSTKTEILALLKRSDGATVDEIASALGLAPMTVRQHLTALERDGLIHAQEVRRATGRPHFRYSLTDGGHRLVAQGYDRLVALLVEAAGAPAALDGATPGERRGRLFREAALALAEKHRGEVLMLSGSQRVARVVEVLQAHGGFAEWHDLAGAWEVRDFSCVYRTSVDDCGPCQWHEPFLAALLGGPIEAAPPSGDCAACCRYLIPTPADGPAGVLAPSREESRSAR
ncbi:MAG: winged helix-turn-helix transcriptional regulator [Chloroflexota bacterium]|nr:winged helix-turn-helix transcriptional regulator [Chloroflexota bacterium]